MSYNTDLKLNKDGQMVIVCPNCGADLGVDWRDWEDTIGDVKIYHLFCERCDAEIRASKNFNNLK